MNRFKQNPVHEFAPQLWRKTHILTGDYDFDGSIEFSARKHPYVNDKVAAHTVRGYGYRTNYRGYSMGGDD